MNTIDRITHLINRFPAEADGTGWIGRSPRDSTRAARFASPESGPRRCASGDGSRHVDAAASGFEPETSGIDITEDTNVTIAFGMTRSTSAHRSAR